MKYIIYIILLTLSLAAENIRWNSNYDIVHSQALEEDKLLMVLLIEKESLSCYKMLSTTFMNQLFSS